ncbi:MAG: ATP synthase subunit I [Desulfobacteraceae bacterium]
MGGQYKEVSQVQKRICSWAMLSALVLAVVFLILQEKAIAKGLVLGTCFSIVNFLLLGKSIPMVLGQSRPRANAIGLASIFSRYFLLAIPMVIAIKSVSFSFVAVVVGIFAVQIVTLFDYLVIQLILGGKKGWQIKS